MSPLRLRAAPRSLLRAMILGKIRETMMDREKIHSYIKEGEMNKEEEN